MNSASNIKRRQAMFFNLGDFIVGCPIKFEDYSFNSPHQVNRDGVGFTSWLFQIFHKNFFNPSDRENKTRLFGTGRNMSWEDVDLVLYVLTAFAAYVFDELNRVSLNVSRKAW